MSPMPGTPTAPRPPLPPELDRAFLVRSLTVIGLALAGALVCVIAWQARLALLIIYLAVIVAAGLWRPVTALEAFAARHRVTLPRWLAALLVYAVVVGAGLAVALVVSVPLVTQVDQLWAAVPVQFDRFQDLLRRLGLLARRVTLQEAVQNIPRSDAVGSMKGIITLGSTVAQLAAGGVSVLILSFYLVIRGDETARWLLRFVAVARRDVARRAGCEAIRRIGRWLEATAVVGGLMGLFALIVLSLLGLPFAYLVALIAACGEAVPLVGPLIAGTVAVTVSLTVSPQLALVVGVLFVLLHELEANVFVPRLMEGRVGVSAIAVICALLVGWDLAGVLGALLAIPTVTWIGVVADHVRLDREARAAAAATHPPVVVRAAGVRVGVASAE